jgi:hypothetical protein
MLYSSDLSHASCFSCHFTGHTQENDAVSKVIKEFISHHTGHNIHCQQREMSTFLKRYQQFDLMLTAGPQDQFPRWHRSRRRRRLSMCSVLTYPDLRLQCSVSFVHGLKNTLFLCGASFLNRTRNWCWAVITDLGTSKRSKRQDFSYCDSILETAPAAPQ